MDKQTVIDELTEFRTMLEACSFDHDCCENCPVIDSCDRFAMNSGGRAVNVVDAAIELLKEKE